MLLPPLTDDIPIALNCCLDPLGNVSISSEANAAHMRAYTQNLWAPYTPNDFPQRMQLPGQTVLCPLVSAPPTSTAANISSNMKDEMHHFTSIECGLQLIGSGGLPAAIEAVYNNDLEGEDSLGNLTTSPSSLVLVGSVLGRNALFVASGVQFLEPGSWLGTAEDAVDHRGSISGLNHLYTTSWEAESPASCGLNAWATDIVGGIISSVGNALTAVQALQSCGHSAGITLQPGSALELPSLPRMSSREQHSRSIAAAMHGILKAGLQEFPDMKARIVQDQSTLVPWTISIPLSKNIETTDPHGSLVADGMMLVPHLRRMGHRGMDASLALPFAKSALLHGSCVVTGGSGTLGALAAAWVVGSVKVPEIVLVSRSAVVPHVVIHSSKQDSVLVNGIRADMSSYADVCGILGNTGAISTILHAGGVLADGLLMKQTLAGMNKVSGVHLPYSYS